MPREILLGSTEGGGGEEEIILHWFGFLEKLPICDQPICDRRRRVLCSQLLPANGTNENRLGGFGQPNKGRVRGGELDVDGSALEMNQGGARVSEGLVDHVFCPGHWALGPGHWRGE